jgi:dipeptidyl aminopeptidase/acylaminoacyl peptidase
VAYESSPGNVNFAKRYGRIGVELGDTADGRSSRIDHPPRGEDLSQSAYNPQLAADGRHLAFQAVRGAGTAQVFVCDLHTGARHAGQRRPAARAAGHGDLDLRAADHHQWALRRVHRRHQPRGRGPGRDVVAGDVARPSPGTRRRRSAPALDGFASDPTVSGDGRLVAFTAGQPMPRLYVRDVAAGSTQALTAPDAGAVVDPQLSDDGRVLAYTVVRGARSHVEVRRLDSGAVEQVASAKGSVTDPSLSADGAVMAFTSDAPDLAPAKTDRNRGVFVRDLRAGTTTRVSAPTKPAPAKPPLPTATAPKALGRRGSARSPRRGSASSTTPSSAAAKTRRCESAPGPSSPGCGAASPRTT